jgi:hypothetical protein
VTPAMLVAPMCMSGMSSAGRGWQLIQHVCDCAACCSSLGKGRAVSTDASCTSQTRRARQQEEVHSHFSGLSHVLAEASVLAAADLQASA